MPDMINFGVYILPKSMLSVTLGKKCCIIKSMSYIIEFISLNIQITKWRYRKSELTWKGHMSAWMFLDDA